jgi:hypothetical protein
VEALHAPLQLLNCFFCAFVCAFCCDATDSIHHLPSLHACSHPLIEMGTCASNPRWSRALVLPDPPSEPWVILGGRGSGGGAMVLGRPMVFAVTASRVSPRRDPQQQRTTQTNSTQSGRMTLFSPR